MAVTRMIRDCGDAHRGLAFSNTVRRLTSRLMTTPDFSVGVVHLTSLRSFRGTFSLQGDAWISISVRASHTFGQDFSTRTRVVLICSSSGPVVPLAVCGDTHLAQPAWTSTPSNRDCISTKSFWMADVSKIRKVA